MSLHSHQFASSGESLTGGVGFGDQGADALYGSLSTLGPRKMKKKPVLVLDEQELAKAHLAIAMGGAEILDAAEPAPRSPQPAMLLGLAPMGQDDTDEDSALYPDHAFDEAEDDEGITWSPAEELVDEDAEGEDEGGFIEDAAYGTLSPFHLAQDEEEDEVEREDDQPLIAAPAIPAVVAKPDSAPAAPASRSLDHLLGGGRSGASTFGPGLDDEDDDSDAVPSIADQLRALRERSLRQAQTQSTPHVAPAPEATARPAPASMDTPPLRTAAPASLPVQPPLPPQVTEPEVASTRDEAANPVPPVNRRATIERLEIDDWARITPVRAIVPPEATPAQPAMRAEPAPPQPARPEPEPAPQPVARAMPPADKPPVAREPVAALPPAETGWDEDESGEAEWPEDSAMLPDAVSLLSVNAPARPAPVAPTNAGWIAEPSAPPSTLRARIREQQERAQEVASPGLLARLVDWIRGLFAR